MADSWGDMGKTMSTLYWSFYGLESQSNADVVLPNTVVKRRTNETVHVAEAGHRLTEVAGYFVYGIYFFCGPMILINLLIAVMSASFHSVTENSDMEWKFARVQAWMIFLADTGTLPPPFNLIPNPAAIYRLGKWLTTCILNRAGKKRDQVARCSAYRCCYLEMANKNLLQDEEEYQKLISTLIQRYFQAIEDAKKESKGNDSKAVSGDVEALRVQLRQLTAAVTELRSEVATAANRRPRNSF